MTSTFPHPSDVNRIWSELMREIRHAQINELQLIRSYVKLQQTDRLDRCLAFSLDRLEQERILMAFGNPLWSARLLPLVYGMDGIRFRFEPIISETMVSSTDGFETAWTYSEWVSRSLRTLLKHSIAGYVKSSADVVPTINVQFILRVSEVIVELTPHDFEFKWEEQLEWSGRPERLANREPGMICLRWKLEEV